VNRAYRKAGALAAPACKAAQGTSPSLSYGIDGTFGYYSGTKTALFASERDSRNTCVFVECFVSVTVHGSQVSPFLHLEVSSRFLFLWEVSLSRF
jgi:hypothetical protein